MTAPISRLRLRLLPAATALIACSGGLSAQTPDVLVRTLPGLHRIEVSVPEGRVTVNLPDDLARGGRYTGTVQRLARSGGAARLNALHVEIPALRQGAVPDRFEFTVDSATPGSLRIEVRETESGALLGEASVPVRTAPPPVVQALPAVGQIGSTVRVRGAFDGDMSNTAAVVSGRETILLAESPRQLVLDMPDAAPGPGDLVIRERDVVLRGPFRVVAVSVEPGSGAVRSGERRAVDIRVAGLAGLEAPLPFRLTVSGPVTVEGGREQRLRILPGSVLPDGRWTIVRNLVAVDSGDVIIGTAIGDIPALPPCDFAGGPVRVSTAPSGARTLWLVEVETALGEKRRLWIEGRRPALRAGQWITLRNCVQEESGAGRASAWAPARDPRRAP